MDYTASLPEQLRERTKTFALRVVRLYRSIPRTPDAQVIGKQLLRSATGVAANYRATCRSRSKAEFAAKIGVVVEEADESLFWLELLTEAEIMPEQRMRELVQEARELTAIFTASRETVRHGRD